MRGLMCIILIIVLLTIVGGKSSKPIPKPDKEHRKIYRFPQEKDESNSGRNEESPEYDLVCAAKYKYGMPHDGCREKLIEIIRQVQKDGEEYSESALGCVEKFCCTQKSRIDIKVQNKIPMLSILGSQYRSCSRSPLNGVLGSFLG